jgi:hypothetical protein
MKRLLLRSSRLLEVALVVAILGRVYFRHPEAVDFHADESHWIATSCFLEALVAPRSFHAPDWLTEILLRETSATYVWGAHYWTLTQPPVARYMIGWGRIAGGYGIADLNVPWDFDAAEVHNAWMGAYPSPGLLWATRAAMAFLAVISGVILFLLVRHCAGAVAGYTFVAFFAGSSYLLTHLRRAMSEAPLVFFTTLTLLCAARALTAAPRHLGRAVAWLLLMGVCAGLAGAAKINGLALGFAAVGLCFIVAYRHRGRDIKCRRVAFLAAFMVMAITLSVFTLVNPFLYPLPLPRLVEMVLFRHWEMNQQMTHPVWHIADLSTRLRILPLRIFRDYPTVHNTFFNELLTVLGLYAMMRVAWRWLRGKRSAAGSGALMGEPV